MPMQNLNSEFNSDFKIHTFERFRSLSSEIIDFYWHDSFVSRFDSDRVKQLWFVQAFFALYGRDNQIITFSVK